MTSTTPLRSNVVRLAVASAAVVALVGCGSDDDSSTTDATTVVSVAATTTEVPAPAEPVETTDPVTTTDAVETTEPATTETVTTEAADTTIVVEGTTYTSAEGDYTVLFPGQPIEQTQSQPLPDGSLVDIVFAGYEFDDGFVAAARSQYPDGYILDPAAALQGAQDQAIANVGGTLVDSTEITLQGRPGREFSATIADGGQTGTLLQRVYLDGLVSYQQIFTGAGQATFTDADLASFFDSFTFTTG